MKYIKKLLMLLMTCLLIIVCVACEFNTKNNNKQDNEYTAEKGTIKEGFIRINGEIRKIMYNRINGRNIYQGDILIADEQLLSTSGLKTKSVVLTSRTWTNNIVNFHISSNVYNEGIIRTAIDHLRKNTNLKFIESTLGNYVDFTLSSIPGVSYSYLGMLGIGRQEIGISQYAMVGTVVHEIGHAIGLEHEHTRADRDDYVTIHYENIDEDYRHNFDINNTVNHEDDGVFDFLSIMLYSSYDFSINKKPTITRKDGSTFGAQSAGFSGGDISGVKRLYGLAAANPVIAVKSADDTYIFNSSWRNNILFEAQLLPPGFGYVLADRKTFTIQNFSECTLTINNIQWNSGSVKFTIDTINTASTLGPGESTTFDIIFSTKDEHIVHEANILINTNDPDDVNFIFNVKGEGVIKPFIHRYYQHSTGSWPGAWAKTFTVKDMNNDGYPDLVWNYTAPDYGNGTWIAYSYGNNTFQTPICYRHSTGSWSGAWAKTFTVKDMNNDGYPDLVWNYTAPAYGNGTWIAYANGNKTFQSPVFYRHSTGSWLTAWAKTFTVKDMNNDGYPDLVWNYTAPDYGNATWIVYSNGDKTFKSPRCYSHSTGSWSSAWTKTFTVRDMNNDGYPDLVWNYTAPAYGNGTWIAYANGNQTFQTPVCYRHSTGIWSGAWAETFTVKDMNNDSYPDLVWNYTAPDYGNGTWIVYSNGNNTFQPPVCYLHSTGSWSPEWAKTFTVKDMNNDSYPDLIWNYTTPGYENGSWIVYSNGDKTFQSPVYYKHFEDNLLFAWTDTFTIEDMNNDGLPDLLWNYTAEDFGNGTWISSPNSLHNDFN